MPFSPAEILATVPEAKRLSRLYAMRQIYAEDIAPRWPNTILNTDVLLHCVESYFCDLIRTKEFHEISLADQHKRAAFTLKWVAKTRPIQIRAEKKTSKAEMLVNEVYALHCGLSHIKGDINLLSPAMKSNLLYTLHYRNLDGEVLSTLMYAIECSLNGYKP